MKEDDRKFYQHFDEELILLAGFSVCLQNIEGIIDLKDESFCQVLSLSELGFRWCAGSVTL